MTRSGVRDRAAPPRDAGPEIPDRLRVRAIAALEAGPRGVLPLLAGVGVVTGSAGLALLLGRGGPAPPRGNVAAGLALAAVLLAALAALAALWVGRVRRARRRGGPGAPPRGDSAVPFRPHGTAPASRVSSAQRDLLTAVMLAAAGVLPALLLPVHYLAARTRPPGETWLAYGFLDKRWITSLYLVTMVGTPLVLLLAARVVATAHGRPESWRSWLGALVPRDAPAPPRGDRRHSAPASALTLLGAALIAWYFFGPPWNLPPDPIGYHETQAMGGVQGLATGSPPYIGTAAYQYGPGTEVADYLVARAAHAMSVDGLRTASLVFAWIAATMFLGTLAVRTRPLAAAVTAVAAFTLFPAFQLLRFTAAGFDHGFWGWTNLLRYAGVYLLALLFPAVVARPRGRRAAAVALGAGWALLCLMAQENLIGGVLVLGALAGLLVLSRTAGRRATGSALVGVAAGFAAVAVPVAAVYAAHGLLGRALELYWLLPSSVAKGYSNIDWRIHSFWTLYHLLPFLLLALLLAALLAARPLRLATEWSERRVVLVSALVAAVICHLGALTRSDGAHLKNTELALPAALCLAAFDLPALLGARSRRARWLGGAAIATAALALLPLAPYASLPQRVAAKLWRPAMARVRPPAPRGLPAGIPPLSVAAARIGGVTVRQPWCCAKHHDIPMERFVRFLDRLHAVIGTRRVYVDGTPSLSPPGIYFLADLRPAPFRQEYSTMVITARIREQWFREFHADLPRIEAIVTTDPRRRAPAMWLAAHPRHRRVAVPYGRRGSAYVFLGAGRPGAEPDAQPPP